MIRRLTLMLLLFALPDAGPGQQKFWIFFNDKGSSAIEKNLQLKKVQADFSQRALSRRAKVLSQDQLIDESDLPIFQPYLDQLSAMGVQPVVQSRWLNAISAKLTGAQVSQIENLSFVKQIKPVAHVQGKPIPEQKIELLAKPQNYKFDYGPSLTQNEIMHVPEVHDLGLDGSDVMVGMLDTGFDYKYHEAFSSLKVKAEYDFINDDSTTQNEGKDPSNQHDHGTYTLSALGGFLDGELIGPAHGATFFLAKTEVVSSETPIEEDYWVAGIEWLERQGADVVNSSLGYLDWYTYENMDGKTAVTTIAADRAVQKGVVVVNSNGNEGNDSWHYMIAPADGFNVISVGAVYGTGELVGFSSRGPTYDGRTKPDVVAMGSGVHVVQPSTIEGYTKVGGTSLSSPLAAGVAALVLQAHPYLTPREVRDALRETASRAMNPDNDYGWGLVNAYDAIFYHGLFYSHQPEIYSEPQLGHQVKIKIFSKNELILDSLFVYYSVSNSDFIRTPLYPSDEQHEYLAWLPAQPEGREIKFYFSATDVSGDSRRHPHTAPDVYFTILATDTTVGPIEPPNAFRLYQNYPNPFDRYTFIIYDVIVPAKVTVIVYNLAGQQVRKLAEDEYHLQSQFSYRKAWDGRDDSGNLVASGIYLYQLKSGKHSLVKRMVFLRARVK